MADPLLTSLCAICHIQPPKYKCPRCTIRTCSLACTKRHKAWSSCNGIRDATAYVPPSRLKTPAGVDHDYNFLSGIERAVQRSEKEIVEERCLLRPEDLRPIEVRSVKWKTDRDGRKRRVLITELLRGGGSGGPSGGAGALSSIPFNKRLDKFGIFLRRAPMGMVRRKENGTNFSKASSRIHWQIEWLLVLPSTQPNRKSSFQKDSGVEGAPETKTERILAKALDDAPLYKAFFMGQKSLVDESARKIQRQQHHQGDGRVGEKPSGNTHDVTANYNKNNNTRPKKRRKHPHKPGQSITTAQDNETGAWHPGRYCMQTNGPRGTWIAHMGVPSLTGTTGLGEDEEAEAQKGKYSFFVVGTTSAAAAAAGKTVVHAVDANLPLGEALRDMTVLEFPTIYVVQSGALLPSALASEPKPVRVTLKRKRQDQSSRWKSGKDNKKMKRSLEEGVVLSEGEVSEEEDEEEEGSLDALHNIIAEQSLGEDDDETTSSSGSDLGDDEDVSASLAAKLALLKKS